MWRLLSQFQSEVKSVYNTWMEIERGTHKQKAKMGVYKRISLSIKSNTQKWHRNINRLDYWLTIAKLSGLFIVSAGEFHEDELPNLSENYSDSDSE